MLKRIGAVILVAALPTMAWAQQAVLQGGSQTAGHIPQYANTGGSTAVIMDGGTAAGGASGVNPSEIGITARGTGTPPYIAQGSGPSGTNFCNYDAPTTNATGYHALCMSPNVSSKGLIDYSYGGTASPQGLDIVVNGYTALSLSSTGVLSQALTDGQFLVGNASNLAADVPMSGDCTLANTGAVTCTTLNSVSPGDLFPLDYDSNFTASGGSLAFANVGAGYVLGNSTGGAAEPTGVTVSSMLDRAFSSTQGSILYRDSTAWAALGPGSSGEVLSSGGAAANPSWIAAPGTGTVTSIATNNGVTGGTITSSGTIGLANIADGQILGNTSGVSAPPSGTSTPILGIDATTAGTIGLANGNATGDTVTIANPSATAGDYNFNLPATAGTSGQLLTSGGGGSSAMTWTTPGTAAVLDVGTSAGNVVQLNGSAELPAVSGANLTNLPNSIDVQTFNSSDTWTKPGSGTIAFVQAWGAGGSGGTRSDDANGGGGGGGGGYSSGYFMLSSLGATETVTIGAGGAAQTSANTAGNAGGNTTFGSHLTAYGGGAGAGGSGANRGGGGGGSPAGAGSAGSGDTGGAAGTLGGAANTAGWAGGGGGSTAAGKAGGVGGGGGGSANVGGASIYGGGGGGGGASAGGASTFGGAGGTGTAGTGGAGAQPGGGGSAGQATSGAGADGRIIVIVW